MKDLVSYGYRRLEVVLVETPQADALEQAISRWWRERQNTELGGRFVPAELIRGMYRDETTTVCGENAHTLVDLAQAASLLTVLKTPGQGSH